MTQTAVSALSQGQQNNSYATRGQPATDGFDIDTTPSNHSTGQALVDVQSQQNQNTTYSFQPYQMNGIVGTAPPGAMYVRALYDYEADDRTSLSFHEGDVIQVITQLESGWWDGVINGVRGWFPSNYCQIITSPDDLPDSEQQDNGFGEPVEDDLDEDPYDDNDEADMSELEELPLEGTSAGDRSKADYWIPQATPDGRLFYYNTMTGESSSELPLESPSSATEAGPRDRMNVNMPDRTRPPPEMMARGLTQDEDEDSEATSASELEGENLMFGRMARNRRSMSKDGISPAPSLDSIHGQYSFAATIPRSFFDDGQTPPLTWSRLVSNMKKAIDRYREAINNGNKSEYVARAEDISDHLRLLLAAGSGTTDNHSGQPSIISTNKALYPHFRDMMSKFSKLVVSSHIAASDFPAPESGPKCLQEADGVLLGVFSYVEVARQQRGEEIPRLFPGFVIGSTTGGSWQNNGLGPRDPITSNFLEDEEGVVEPTAVLDGKLLERLDELKRMLVSGIRELDKQLVIPDKIVTPFKHEVVSNNVCAAGGKVIENFKPWIAMIESIDLSSLENSFQTPQLTDFSINKQSLYDNISDLSYTEGDSNIANNLARGAGTYSKVKKIFGEDPTPQQTAMDETPDYLRLEGGSLMALAEQLTRHDKLDSNFNNTFLLTYRSFTTARELFELLVHRFGIQPPEGLSPSDFENWRERKQSPIRFRVVNILKNWFETFWMEDNQEEDTKALIRDVYNFARDTVKSTETPGSAPLMAVLDQRLSGKDVGRRLIQTQSQPTPAPIMPKNMKKLKFLDIDPTEFARQLTIIESRLYGKIKPTECLNKRFQKKTVEGQPPPAPNIKALIDHSNQMTNWVAEMILAQSDVKKRVVVIKHFVSVADKCRQLNNFSTITSIISALGTAPIARLKRTWDQVPQKSQAALEALRKLMLSTKNFAEYRESLHMANPPCIPFFGVYLTDLTFIEDGIPSIIKKTTLINFAKRAKTADVIRDIQQYQNVPYSLQPVTELQDYILSNMQAAGDVHEMYDKSLLIEPREREDEKIVRVLAESGFL
ncbi:putative cell division control protein 25 [Diaporthe ampelina]|uniref:Class E vacuolar protein-sorting machinery protein HSE1 n=1 Tax=Diaporthe ampelina TaxID=1214573 RepID=A0A0G2FFS3_9PEZI|nr:putative cell division control protein 25 [Diaporthe ampelina]